MEILLFMLILTVEAVFLIYELQEKRTKKQWSLKRLLFTCSEFIIYLIMLPMPGIDLGFRWKGLLILLAVRIFFSAFTAFICKGNEKTKKKYAIILLSLGSILLSALSMMPALLFKDYKGLPTSGPFNVSSCNAILIDRSRTDEFESDGSFREVPVYFYYPQNTNISAVADGEDGSIIADDSLPLIVFSHGAFGYYESNTSTYMELASNGYIVVSLDHPHHAIFTHDSDGKVVTVDPEFFNTSLMIGSVESNDTIVYEITSVWMKLREDDINFVLDCIKETDKNGEFSDAWYFPEGEEDFNDIFRCLDTEKIGLMGHSLGGAAAVTVGRRNDVSAVIDLDGTMLGEQMGVYDDKILLNETPYDTPLLAFDSESHHADRVLAKETGYVYVNDVILDNADEGYSTYIEGSLHMNFTDLPLFAPFIAEKLGLGSADPVTCIETVNRICLEFYDAYLKGDGEFTVDEKY